MDYPLRPQHHRVVRLWDCGFLPAYKQSETPWPPPTSLRSGLKFDLTSVSLVLPRLFFISILHLGCVLRFGAETQTIRNCSQASALYIQLSQQVRPSSMA